MAEEWRRADEALRQLRIAGNDRNEPVVFSNVPDGLRCIGVGTDAAVFVYEGAPAYAFKVYSDYAAGKKAVEAEIYERLRGLSYFPVYYGQGDGYIVLSREEGPTLQDCLLEGIIVPEQVIRDVDDAREAVRARGLNPRDIHLKNVLLQNGRAKLLDVSEYAKPGDDKRWEHLTWAYDVVYPSIAGKRVPEWAIEAVKRGYAVLDERNVNLDEFASRIQQWVQRFRSM